ncbi:hypothetical protein [Clostridium ganghwense]|uniref:DUF1642 domain-containing protein n=1 Tax=Clostridium ganghwense TaxID=312089 RepID=A0ABT4CTV7_9CLOT|nr:hypothetical protein [Clostridium ganghwense]MCY6372489.1 hypothetical protein [Clostridium ganghwense]
MNINKVLDISKYAEQSKKDFATAAGAIEKMFSFLTVKEFETIKNLLECGHVNEVYDLMDAFWKEKVAEEMYPLQVWDGELVGTVKARLIKKVMELESKEFWVVETEQGDELKRWIPKKDIKNKPKHES